MPPLDRENQTGQLDLKLRTGEEAIAQGISTAIADGQLVEVDGSTGTVRLLPGTSTGPGPDSALLAQTLLRALQS